jgi:uncharacterized membrane protein YgcG
MAFFGGMVYLGEFALRVPSLRLRRAARLRIWLVPLIGVGGFIVLMPVCLFFLGPGAAAVMYYLTFAQVADELGGVLKRTGASDRSGGHSGGGGPGSGGAAPVVIGSA